MKIKVENFNYYNDYVLLHLSKPIPNNFEPVGTKGWPIGLKNLTLPSFFNGKPLPPGLEKASELRESIKRIDGIKSVYLEEYAIYIDLTPALTWDDVVNEISNTVKTFFKADTVKMITN